VEAIRGTHSEAVPGGVHADEAFCMHDSQRVVRRNPHPGSQVGYGPGKVKNEDCWHGSGAVVVMGGLGE
jgi:hypothetical protein